MDRRFDRSVTGMGAADSEHRPEANPSQLYYNLWLDRRSHIVIGRSEV